MDVLEDEWYAVRYSGEIPEVALHSALYYLSRDAGGPGLKLGPEQKRSLVEAAEMRYQEIVLRDMQQVNRETPAYRGIKRSIINWHRYRMFCRRQQLESGSFRREAAAALLLFVKEEMAAVEGKRRETSINCTYDELRGFAAELGLPAALLPGAAQRLCCPQIPPMEQEKER